MVDKKFVKILQGNKFITHEINCSVKNCFEDKNEGDSLFCIDCRDKWRLTCNSVIGADKQATEYTVANILTTFQQGSLLYK